MKAATYVAGKTQIVFPVEATDKFDGIRCVKEDGKALTSAFKPIPNDFIRTWIEANCPDGFDGEIMVIGRTFNDLSGDVRRKDGEPDFRYHVFDYVLDDLSVGYSLRVHDLLAWWRSAAVATAKQRVVLETPHTAINEQELAAIEASALARGREGVMIRSATSPYKCGRSTINEGYLIKIKRFEDDEAECIGVEEEMENTNVAEEDNFGRTKRSKHAEGMMPKGTMGKLVCKTKAGVVFEIGTGYTALQRQEIWDAYMAALSVAAKAGPTRQTLRPTPIGRLVKYKHQPHGAKDKPRCPVFLGFREAWDL